VIRIKYGQSKALVAALLHDDVGQDLIEYSLLAGFVALSAAAVLNIMAGQIKTILTSVSDYMTAAGS
jgi:Flp pilus assembly pilin Flp